MTNEYFKKLAYQIYVANSVSAMVKSWHAGLKGTTYFLILKQT